MVREGEGVRDYLAGQGCRGTEEEGQAEVSYYSLFNVFLLPVSHDMRRRAVRKCRLLRRECIFFCLSPGIRNRDGIEAVRALRAGRRAGRTAAAAAAAVQFDSSTQLSPSTDPLRCLHKTPILRFSNNHANHGLHSASPVETRNSLSNACLMSKQIEAALPLATSRC